MSLFQVTKKQVIENYELRTMTGDIVSFTPSYSQLLPDPFSDLNVTVNVLATGGNGTPDNPNPINGYTEANITRCGVNLFKNTFNNTTINQISYTKNSDGSMSVSGTATGGFAQAQTNVFLKAGNYIISDNCTFPRNSGLEFYCNASASATTRYNDNVSFTVTKDGVYNVYIYVANGVSIDTTIYPMIRCASVSDTTYHPYTGNTYTIAFGQTVYGGVLDVTRGKLTVTHILKKVSDISWTYRTISGVTGYIFLSNDITGAKAGQSPTMASCYAIKTNRNYIDGDGQVAISNNTTALDIVVKDDTYTSADDFVQNRGNETFVFELATPFDIDLTPEVISAFVGTNNVFADCGNVTVTCLI